MHKMTELGTNASTLFGKSIPKNTRHSLIEKTIDDEKNGRRTKL